MDVQAISPDGATVKLTRHEIRILRYSVAGVFSVTAPLDAHPLIGVEYDTLKEFWRQLRRLAEEADPLD
jgi:hypothetical protein